MSMCRVFSCVVGRGCLLWPVPDHPTCLLRNLYAGQEATVRTGHGTTDWFQIGKGVRQGYILSPCFFNFYAQYIMRNTGLDEARAGIKIAGRNINNLRYADDTTIKAESKEKLKPSWWGWKKEWKSWLESLHKKSKIMTSAPITSWQIEGRKVEAGTYFLSLVYKITEDSDYRHEKKRNLET